MITTDVVIVGTRGGRVVDETQVTVEVNDNIPLEDRPALPPPRRRYSNSPSLYSVSGQSVVAH